MDATKSNAKKHASRARRSIKRTGPVDASADAARTLVDTFLSAAAGGDIDQMIALIADDDCVRVADPALVPLGPPTVISGAQAVAREDPLIRSLNPR